MQRVLKYNSKMKKKRKHGKIQNKSEFISCNLEQSRSIVYRCIITDTISPVTLGFLYFFQFSLFFVSSNLHSLPQYQFRAAASLDKNIWGLEKSLHLVTNIATCDRQDFILSHHFVLGFHFTVTNFYCK